MPTAVEGGWRGRLGQLGARLGRHGSNGGGTNGGGTSEGGGGGWTLHASRRRVLSIVLPIALILQFVVVDRVSVQLVEHEMARQIRSGVVAGMPCGTRPPTVRDVSIGGFPFLTQVLTGTFSDLGMTLTDMPTPGPRIEAISARLQGVHVPILKLATGGDGEITVDRMRAAVRMTYADLNTYLATQTGRIHITAVDGGSRLEISATVEVPLLGTQQVAGIVTFAVHNNQLTLVPSQISLKGIVNLTIPLDFLAGALAALPIPLGDLPFNLIITTAETDATGLSVTATASDVTLPSMEQAEQQCTQAQGAARRGVGGLARSGAASAARG
ncbi:DUF2993 domain-containing protein [Frankia sp. Ag45/Mut15]|uniref:DUF2993 domain-containing protein n=1 Tax=Frankia umida TaxID=573489 RepID=A0ABT0K1Q6_9ACTN|nr:DUF2993 domain-containing protein [Frankia umida]MCK9877727.1 DUF2993 domain-containing protein [Frankia umida]